MTLCGGWGGVGCYDQLFCSASPKLLLGLDLGLGCDNFQREEAEGDISIMLGLI